MIHSSFNMTGRLRCHEVLPDGKILDHGVIACDRTSEMGRWQSLYWRMRRSRAIPACLSFGTFLSWALGLSDPQATWSVVTTAGVSYMAADFLAASAARINAFKYHDTGTGTNAEAIGNVALQTPTGIARSLGVGANPTAIIYESVASITYDGAYNITEWGLFSALAGGTLWDRRVFAAIPVVLGTVKTWTYDLTINAGG